MSSSTTSSGSENVGRGLLGVCCSGHQHYWTIAVAIIHYASLSSERHALTSACANRWYLDFPIVPVVSYWDWTTFPSTSTIILWDDHWCMGKLVHRLSSPSPLLSLTTKDLLSRWGVYIFGDLVHVNCSSQPVGGVEVVLEVSVTKGALRETRCCMLSAVIAGLYIIMSAQISCLTEETILL